MREEGEASCEGAEESTNLWAEALSCRRRRLGCEVSLGRRGDWRGRCSRLDGPKLCRPTYPQNRLFLFAETFGATHRPGPFTKPEQPVEHSDFGLQLKGGRRGGPGAVQGELDGGSAPMMVPMLHLGFGFLLG
jgi:hypothetical protein